MTLRNIPVDLSKLSGLLCTSAPEVRADINTGEIRTDRTTGLPLFLVGVLVKVEGERRAYVLDVQVPGEPAGLVEGQPVTIESLEAAPWERDGRSGVVYRATAIRPGQAAPAASPVASASASQTAPTSAEAVSGTPGRPNRAAGGGGS
jgi:hypothetical protein